MLIVTVLLLGGAISTTAPTAAHSLFAPNMGASPGLENPGAYMVPGTAIDGVLTISIPPGTGAKMRNGQIGYVLPSVIQLHVGDTIVIQNNDVLPHMMLFTFILPGERIERTFDQITTETYSAGCTMDPTPSGFTSLFVSE